MTATELRTKHTALVASFQAARAQFETASAAMQAARDQLNAIVGAKQLCEELLAAAEAPEPQKAVSSS